MKHVIKPASYLFFVAAVTTALLVLTHAVTLEPIANQHKKAREKMMREILTRADAFQEIPAEKAGKAEKSGSLDRVFEAFNGGETIGWIVELSPGGYGGAINMMVGISKEDDAVAGIRVLRHSETPGLGALAATERFYRKYEGRKLVPLKVVRSRPHDDEIDAITSATITTQAVTDAVNEAIKWYAERVSGE